MKLTSIGKDDLGTFTVECPGHCSVCDTDQDIVVVYNRSKFLMGLKDRGINPSTPSLLLKKPYKIGVTCGDYAKFHRQIAHISTRRMEKS